MTLAELIRRVRTEANDKAQPYFWSDEDITYWLNDAQDEAAVRGRLFHERANRSVCQIAVTAGRDTYLLHPALYELTRVAFVADGKTTPLVLVSRETLDRISPDWREHVGRPEWAVQDDRSIQLVPKPDIAGTVSLEGYRLALQPMEAGDDEPELHAAHHRHLINWALHRGFSVPDMETFDPTRAATAERAFAQYFGLRPDADLRRITREDVPHHVEAFWP